MFELSDSLEALYHSKLNRIPFKEIKITIIVQNKIK